MDDLSRPLVGVTLFTRDDRAYALFDRDGDSEDISTADWEMEHLPSQHPMGTSHWYESAFAACLNAYRRLQARHPDKDLVLTIEDLGLGELPIAWR